MTLIRMMALITHVDIMYGDMLTYITAWTAILSISSRRTYITTISFLTFCCFRKKKIMDKNKYAHIINTYSMYIQPQLLTHKTCEIVLSIYLFTFFFFITLNHSNFPSTSSSICIFSLCFLFCLKKMKATTRVHFVAIIK